MAVIAGLGTRDNQEAYWEHVAMPAKETGARTKSMIDQYVDDF